LLAAAKNVASVVLFLGEDTYTEKPGDILDLELSATQQHLIKVYKKAGKKVIVVLLEGRPRTFANSELLCDAIIFAGLPGDAGGTALANVLCGLSNPSGKLPFTYPRYSGFHLTYDCKYTEVLNKDFKPLGFNPLFEFGSGLSYTDYVYSNFTCDKESYTLTDTIKMNVTISNTGAMEGLHTALFYSKDEVASITPSVKKLRAFRKIFLKPGASEIVSIELPVQHLAFVGLSNKWGVEPGSFKLSADTLIQNITITNK
jgi:beta-glucosidase